VGGVTNVLEIYGTSIFRVVPENGGNTGNIVHIHMV
jgi:hypothetical protein